jgi:2,3,4,5-tetrahydropyridine-2,6-dicarboxylate N-succinyltransferase
MALARGDGDVHGRDGRAVERVIGMLDAGELRVAEPRDGGWVTNVWIKEAILLFFARRNRKLPLKKNYRKHGVRCVRPGVARYGSFLARGVVLMPGFVNIGAYVGEGSMIDTWATVGSCAQIGRNVHLSGGVGVGGVLEPLQANPTIIEDDCFIGARSEVVEGVIVGAGSVLSMGVFLGQSTRIYDRASGTILQGRVPPGSVVVPGTLPAADGRYSLYCAVIVKQVDAQTRAKTSINELLRAVD